MAKTIFEQLGGRYERQGDYLLPLSDRTRGGRTADRRMGRASLALSERIPQRYIYQSAYRRQAERLPCGD